MWTHKTKDDRDPFPWASSPHAQSTILDAADSEKLISVSRVNGPSGCISKSISALKPSTPGMQSNKDGVIKKRRTDSEKWMSVFLTHTQTISELLDLYQEAERSAPGSVIFQLPRFGALAGAVVSHAMTRVEDLFERHDPCIFKFGWTHNPAWRWNGRLYGYRHDKDKWTAMIILHYSLEPHGPAMLEGALIHRFQSTLAWKLSWNLFVWWCINYKDICHVQPPTGPTKVSRAAETSGRAATLWTGKVQPQSQRNGRCTWLIWCTDLLNTRQV